MILTVPSCLNLRLGPTPPGRGLMPETEVSVVLRSESNAWPPRPGAVFPLWLQSDLWLLQSPAAHSSLQYHSYRARLHVSGSRRRPWPTVAQPQYNAAM